MLKPIRFLALAVALSSSAPAFAQETNDDALAAFASLKRDKAPEAITRDTHYWTGNENNLPLFHPFVKDVGGVYIGVGTDQNYLLAGWAKSSVLVLMDFDQSVVDLHSVYRAIFRQAETPEAFFDLWHAKKRKTVRKLIKAEFKEQKRVKWAALKAYGVARWSVYRRLKRVKVQMAKAELPSFLTDQAQYDHVRALVIGNKTFALRGDLTARRALRSIGAAATASDLKVGVLYLSNAEQYFRYKKSFRINIKSLPFSDNSVVIRTSGWTRFRSVKGKDYYHYNVQSGPSFHAFVDDKKIWDVASVLKLSPPTETRGFSHLTVDPEEARKLAKERAPKRSKKGKKRKSKKRSKKAPEAKSEAKSKPD